MNSKTFALSFVPAAALVAFLVTSGRPSGEAAGSCCAREPEALVCTLTGETLSECCCRPSPDGLVCEKTGEVLAECCCTGNGRR